MNLKWDLVEIQQRIKEIINLLKNTKLDSNYYRLYSELLNLSSMLYFIKGMKIELRDHLNKKQRDFIDKYQNDEANRYIRMFKQDIKLHKQVSDEVIKIFRNSHFHLYDGTFNTVRMKDNIGIVRDFLQQFDTDQYKYFNDLFSQKSIEISNKKCQIYNGVTYLSYNKPYILCTDTNNINFAVTLVHEFGHAYNMYKNNFELSNRNDISTEINSYFMEYRFLDYLINNGIFIDDALLIQNQNMYDIYNNIINLSILTEIENIGCNIYYNVLNTEESIRSSILKLDRNKQNILLKNGLSDLNMYGILNYAYGNLLGLLYSMKYDLNKEETKYEIEGIIQRKMKISSFIYLDGLSKQLVLNNKNML